MDTTKAILLFEFAKPLLQACAAILTLCVGIFAVRQPRTTALSVLSTACFITVVVDLIYLSGSLQTQWNIVLFPRGVRRVLFLVAEVLFLVEVFLWPIALFLLIRERRACMSPTI